MLYEVITGRSGGVEGLNPFQVAFAVVQVYLRQREAFSRGIEGGYDLGLLGTGIGIVQTRQEVAGFHLLPVGNGNFGDAAEDFRANGYLGPVHRGVVG